MGFMDKISAPKFSGRHSRSTGRTRREESPSNNARDSYESAAGNLSPGRFGSRGRGESRRPEPGFSFLKGKKSSSRNQSPGPIPENNPRVQDAASQNEDDRSRSPSFKLKNLFGRTNSKDNLGNQQAIAQQPSRDLLHEIQVLEAQLHDYENLKKRLKAEERLCSEWREKWNYQNFKLNLMVDMLVLRVLESEQVAAE